MDLRLPITGTILLISRVCNNSTGLLRGKKLQAFIENIHRAWTYTREYMPPPESGKPVTLDPALIMTPPAGLELGYVPLATAQEVIR